MGVDQAARGDDGVAVKVVIDDDVAIGTGLKERLEFGELIPGTRVNDGDEVGIGRRLAVQEGKG